MRLERRDFHFVLLVVLTVLVFGNLVYGAVAKALDLHDYTRYGWLSLLLAIAYALYLVLRWAFLSRYVRERLLRQKVAGAGGDDEVVAPAPIVTRRGFIYRASAAGVFGGLVGLVAGRVVGAGESVSRAFREGADPGREFHRATRLDSAELLETAAEHSGQWWRERPGDDLAWLDGAPVTVLPREFALASRLTVEDAIHRRRSRRAYGEGLTLGDLSRLLHFAAGKTGETSAYGGETVLRAAPSHAALYPVSVYVVANAVDGLTRGVYRYRVEDHALLAIREGDFRRDIAAACAAQGFVKDAGAVLVLTGHHDRAGWRANRRGYRNILLEAGHIAQNAYLAGEAMGLAVCAVSSFFDSVLNDLLQVSRRGAPESPAEEAVYVVAVGTGTNPPSVS